MNQTIRGLFGFVILGIPFIANASILNGGFENYNTGVADGGGIGPGYFTYNAGNAGVDDWTIANTSVDIVTVPPGVYPIYSGNAALDLVGTPGPGSISQTVATTIGQLYDVSFWGYSTGGGLNEEVYVSATGSSTSMFTVTGGSWNQYTYSFTASSATTTIGFASSAMNTGNGNTFLDEIEMEAVPEPMTMVVLGGAAAMAALRRRKK